MMTCRTQRDRREFDEWSLGSTTATTTEPWQMWGPAAHFGKKFSASPGGASESTWTGSVSGRFEHSWSPSAAPFPKLSTLSPSGASESTWSGSVSSRTEHSSGSSLYDSPTASPKRFPAEDKVGSREADWSRHVVEAVRTLYMDQVRPTVGEVTRRLAELQPALTPLSEKAPVLALAATCKELVVSSDAILFLDAPVGFSGFVDPNEKADPFPTEVWMDLGTFFVEWMRNAPTNWPRGRYSMAKALQESGGDFAATYTLGQLNHLVQLAIGKRLLVHEANQLKPVAASREHAKGLLDASGRTTNKESDLRSIQTWDELRKAVRLLLNKYPEGFALSQFPRFLSLHLHAEVVPRMLGHAKISVALTDPEMRAACAVYVDDRHSSVLCPPASVCPPRRGLRPFTLSANARASDSAGTTYAVEDELVTFLYLRSQLRQA
jgi:hypothetical protein